MQKQNKNNLKKTNVENISKKVTVKKNSPCRFRIGRQWTADRTVAAMLQAAVMVLCVQCFLSGAVFTPQELVTGWLTWRTGLGMMGLWVLFSLACCIFPQIGEWGPTGFTGAVLLVSLCHGGGVGLAVILFFLLLVALPGKKNPVCQRQVPACSHEKERIRSAVPPAVIVSALLFLLAVGGIGTLRYLNFRTPDFDFGIFCQMFEGMRRTGWPVTTCERGQSLSHFAVHLSPALYLLLPFYELFAHPLTLVWLQVIGLALGVWPLWLLCRHYGLGRTVSGCLAAAYLFHPALLGGCLYDFHENFLLAPFLFTLFLMGEKKRWGLCLAAAAAVCLVKEDAAIYVCCVSLYWALRRQHEDSRWDKATPALLTAGALAWFFFAAGYVAGQGQESLALVHYRQYLGGISSGSTAGQNALTTLAVNLLQNPLYVLKTSFQADRWPYLLQMFLPLLFLPLAGCRPDRLWLLAPMLVFNLMTDYPYQHDICFQYQFGTLAFLFYMTVQTLGEQGEKQTVRVTAAAACACLISLLILHGTRVGYVHEWRENDETYKRMEAILQEVSDQAVQQGKTVAASTMLLAHLWQVEELYEISQKGAEADLILLDLRYEQNRTKAQEYRQKGYQLQAEIPDFLVWLTAPCRQQRSPDEDSAGIVPTIDPDVPADRRQTLPKPKKQPTEYSLSHPHPFPLQHTACRV